MEVQKADERDIGRVFEIITSCRLKMQAAGSDQWDHIYPALENVREDARTGSLFILRIDNDIAAAVCLNEIQSPEYEGLAWRCADERALVVHRLCVDPVFQGTGAARKLMDFAEAFAASNGFSAIRLDTYDGNSRALELYLRRGYRKTGEVRFPRRTMTFTCFEKLISEVPVLPR